MNSKQPSILGYKGEKQAQEYLKKKNYTILQTNFYIAKNKGEIDIIAHKDNTYLFVEVKTRKRAYDIPLHSLVPLSKQKKIIRTALAFCHTNNIIIADSIIQFDIAYIINKKIEYYSNAFTLS